MPKTTKKSANKKVSFKNPFAKFKSLNRKKKMLVSMLSVLLIAGIGAAVVTFTQAAAPSNAQTTWFWPSQSGGMTSLQSELTVEALDAGSPPYYWAMQGWFINGGPIYMGLQSNGNSVSGVVGKTAVFSIFDTAIEGTPGNCVVINNDFDGYAGRVGTSCRIPFQWEMNHKYQLTMSYHYINGNGRVWSGWVKDLNTGADTKIGSVNIPSNWGGLINQTTSWTEYFGADKESCVLFPLSRVRFTNPRGSVGYPNSGAQNSERDAGRGCANWQIENVVDGVVQQHGGYTNTAKNSVPATSYSTQPAPAPVPALPPPAPAPPVSKN